MQSRTAPHPAPGTGPHPAPGPPAGLAPAPGQALVLAPAPALAPRAGPRRGSGRDEPPGIGTNPGGYPIRV
ncbi:hypothetical protein Slala04_19230 [Streptomyces lavendulae subsp. lavendulae]|nr:hypothetical protein Slala04_19230 [Streptomyces lavendulae subsp. lavendulae]